MIKNQCYVYDLDDTLILSPCKVKISNESGNIISMSPSEYNHYKYSEGDIIDLSDFHNGDLLIDSDKLKMFDHLKEIDDKISSGFNHKIYILTARYKSITNSIYLYMKSQGIKNLSIDNIICVGDMERPTPTHELKSIELEKLSKKYNKIHFFDDSEKNILSASKIMGVIPYLVR